MVNHNVLPEGVNNIYRMIPDPDTTKPKGNTPFHKVRLCNYRIVYEIQDNILLIMIVAMGPRKDICRNTIRVTEA